MRINKAGMDLIKHFEGLKLESYKCPAGVWTIGYGHTEGVYKGMKITPEEAEELLKNDIAFAENAVQALTQIKLNENEFSALVSFVFNVGEDNFKRSSMLKYLNIGEVNVAASEFIRWNKVAGKALAGLTRRREAERKLFTTPPYEENPRLTALKKIHSNLLINIKQVEDLIKKEG